MLVKISLLLLFLVVVNSVCAEELARLFFTAQQRAALELEHLDNTLVINGIVQKNGGKRTIWVNGVAQPPASSDERAPESAAVIIAGKQVKVKVGQKVHFRSAE